MKELGGYLELENLIHNEYYPNAIALNTARNALAYLVESKKMSKVYLPYYLCESVFLVCEREKVDYEFYHIDDNFMPIFNRSLGPNEYLYIVNYFGQISNNTIEAYKEKYKSVIIDNVQAFFSNPVDGVDTIYSCRKFFGVPDGAYLVSDAEKLDLKTDVSKDRMTHILGRYEGKSASEYYLYFQSNDSLFEKLPNMYMSKLTHNILGAIDYNSVKDKRNKNWLALHDALNKRNKLTLQTPQAPYMYPYYCNDGKGVRKKLADINIYIPTLWPNVLKYDGCTLEKEYAVNILPLPVDQRYNEQDMQRLIDELLKII